MTHTTITTADTSVCSRSCPRGTVEIIINGATTKLAYWVADQHEYGRIILADDDDREYDFCVETVGWTERERHIAIRAVFADVACQADKDSICRRYPEAFAGRYPTDPPTRR